MHIQALLLGLLLWRALAAPVSQQATARTFSTSGSLYGPLSLLGGNPTLPTPTSDTTLPDSEIEYAPGQASDSVGGVLDFSAVPTPQPIRGSKGGTDPGPRQIEIDRTHPDILAPPQSDKGDVPQLSWPMALSHSKLGLNRAGWSRQQNLAVLPAAKQFAGVDMVSFCVYGVYAAGTDALL